MSGLSADVAEATKEARKHLLAALLRANVDATVWRETADRLDALVAAAHARGVAAAHARGVAEERARWLAAIEATEHPGHCETCCASNLAAMAPTSPSDAPGAPEGGGGA